MADFLALIAIAAFFAFSRVVVEVCDRIAPSRTLDGEPIGQEER
jgi:hypothetical protein